MKKIFFITLSLLILLGGGYVNTASAVIRNSDSANLRIKFNQGIPYILVKIQGKKIPLEVDTGCTTSDIFLSEKVLKKIQVNYHSATAQYQNSDGKKFVEKKFTVPEVSIGQFVVGNVEGAVYHPWGTQAGAKITPEELHTNGVIGLGLLKKFDLIVDYPHKKMVLIKNHHVPKRYDVAHWSKIVLDKNNNAGMVSAAVINHKPLKILFDTGANFNLLNPSTGLKGAVSACSENHFGNGEKCEYHQFSQMTLGQHILNEIKFVLLQRQEPRVDAIFGKPFFDENIVYFDFNKSEMALQPMRKS